MVRATVLTVSALNPWRPDRLAVRGAAADDGRGHRRLGVPGRRLPHRRAGAGRRSRVLPARAVPRSPGRLARADPAQRDARTQFYIAYSFYRQGWGRVYNDDVLFTQGVAAIERAIALAPNQRLVVQDPGLGMPSADELRAELQRGLTREASDFNPLRCSGSANDSDPRSVAPPGDAPHRRAARRVADRCRRAADAAAARRARPRSAADRGTGPGRRARPRLPERGASARSRTSPAWS